MLQGIGVEGGDLFLFTEGQSPGQRLGPFQGLQTLVKGQEVRGGGLEQRPPYEPPQAYHVLAEPPDMRLHEEHVPVAGQGRRVVAAADLVADVPEAARPGYILSAKVPLEAERLRSQ
jgi:hypothetical protein